MPEEFPGDLRRLYADDFDADPDTPLKIPCPFHHETEPSFAVYNDHGYCYGCRKWVGFWAYLKHLGLTPEGIGKVTLDVPVVAGTRRSRVSTYVPPEDLMGLVEAYQRRLYVLGKEGYYRDRGIDDKTIVEFKLGHTGDAYSVPVWRLGELTTIRFRRDDARSPNGQKYWGVPGLNEAKVFLPRLGQSQPLVWCEGELDALLLLAHGYKALTITNGVGIVDSIAKTPDAALVEALDYIGLFTVPEVVVLLDYDKASYTRAGVLAHWLQEQLPGLKVRVPEYDHKDITGVWQHGGEAAVRKLLWPLPFSVDF